MNIKKLIPDSIKIYFLKILHAIWLKSLESSVKEQGINGTVIKLEQIVPDITNQYSSFAVDTTFLNKKVRGVHSFQISLLDKTIREFANPIIVDVGDSSGTHLQYIAGLYSSGRKIKCISVNSDINAVSRIKDKGLDAIHSKVEDINWCSIKADIFLCFETLEHLMDPCRFLYELSSKTDAKYLIVTVPYVKQSRVGLEHIRYNNSNYNTSSERVHIFELDPEDWKLLIRHSGWDIVEERIYLQYPRKNILRITKPLWQRYDFEGFYGFILKKDGKWSSKYIGW